MTRRDYIRLDETNLNKQYLPDANTRMGPAATVSTSSNLLVATDDNAAELFLRLQITGAGNGFFWVTTALYGVTKIFQHCTHCRYRRLAERVNSGVRARSTSGHYPA
jgi:hypothetical protein